MSLDFLDFLVEVTAQNVPVYQITVRSSAGDITVSSIFPYNAAQLETERLRVENAVLYTQTQTRRNLPPYEQIVRDFGAQLFDFLLPVGDARSLYNECIREASFSQKGVRLKLLIREPILNTLPWEFLYDPRRRDYMVLDPHTPVVRYPELPQRTAPLMVIPPLRVLGLVSNPSDLNQLNVIREKRQVQAALQPLINSNLVQLTWLPGQTAHLLQQYLRPINGPWHIFHYIGHGEFDQRRDEGRIFLADEHGRSQPLSATQLSRLLSAQRGSLRLAVLNTCEGARGGNFDILSSTAATLVLGELPAVLAMQYQISDAAALIFARTFYSALADNLPVDAAVTDARNAINLHDGNSLEWSIPVLYTRMNDGRLFTLQKKATDKVGKIKNTPGTLWKVPQTTKKSIHEIWAISWPKVQDWLIIIALLALVVISLPQIGHLLQDLNKTSASPTTTVMTQPTASALVVPMTLTTSVETATTVPTPSLTANDTLTANRAVQGSVTPTLVLVIPTTTVMNGVNPTPTVRPTATKVVLATRTATATPLPSPSPTAGAQRTAVTPVAPVVSNECAGCTVTLDGPAELLLSGRPTFRWTPSFELGTQYLFELVFWEEGQSAMQNGRSPIGAGAATSAAIDLDRSAAALGLREGVTYKWGVLLVDAKNPSKRIIQLSPDQKFQLQLSSSSNGGGNTDEPTALP